MIGEALVDPFLDFGFMRRALVGCVAVSLGAAPVGIFLTLRRMSLMGDAISHAVLPGVAVGFLLAGFSLFAMTAGGLVAGLAVALGAGALARFTAQKEDMSLAALHLVSLATGVAIVAVSGSNVDLMHVLFGSVLGLEDNAVLLLAAIATASLVGLALLLRPLVLECFDPEYLRAVSGWSAPTHYGFLALVVLNLVGGFHAVGTLLAVGLMILPAATARFWTREIGPMAAVAVGSAVVASFAGLLLSFHVGLPSGPAIVLALGALYVVSFAFGRHGSLAARRTPAFHLEG